PLAPAACPTRLPSDLGVVGVGADADAAAALADGDVCRPAPPHHLARLAGDHQRDDARLFARLTAAEDLDTHPLRVFAQVVGEVQDRKSTRLNSSHGSI